GFFSVRYGFVGHNIVNPTTSRDNPREQAALVRRKLVTTLNALSNIQPAVASERQVDIPE
ncbi:MAG: hypothetical protein QF696_12745, partial [Acidimicrobiales bacterium]|nr:hypothetical protein [Acidimicrobiales bacterium]